MNKFLEASLIAAVTTFAVISTHAETTSVPAPATTQNTIMPHGQHEHMQHQNRFTPEQRAEHQAQREAMQNACKGQPVGKTIQVKVGAKTFTGKCDVRFVPNKVEKALATKG